MAFTDNAEAAIFELLRAKPDHAYVTFLRDQLYAKVPGEDVMYCWTADFTHMTVEEANDYIQNHFTLARRIEA